MRLHQIYLIIGLVSGLCYVLVTPPFQVPDEANHFYRCYQLSTGRVLPQKRGPVLGGEVPGDLVSTVAMAAGNQIPEPGAKVKIGTILTLLAPAASNEGSQFASFPNSALYSPAPYLPQTAGMLVGRALRLSPLCLVYIGRLFNVLCTIMLAWFAIKRAPVFKHVLFLIALTPMFVYEAASLSPDGLTNGLALLLVGTVLSCKFGRREGVPTRTLWFICLLSVLLGLCKSLYFPLPLLYFIIPQKRIGKGSTYYAAGIAIFAAGFAASFLWMIPMRHLFVAYIPGGWSDLSQPRAFIVAHPVLFAKMILINLAKYTPFYIRSGIGYLGWLEVKLPFPILAGYFAALCGAALTGGDSKHILTRRPRALAASIAIVGSILIVISQFILWTEAGSNFIRPAQGRHFIPYAAVWALLLYNRRYAGLTPSPLLDRLLAGFCSASLLVAMLIVARHSYIA